MARPHANLATNGLSGLQVQGHGTPQKTPDRAVSCPARKPRAGRIAVASLARFRNIGHASKGII
jgi:hypothetical protein